MIFVTAIQRSYDNCTFVVELSNPTFPATQPQAKAATRRWFLFILFRLKVFESALRRRSG